MKRTELTAEEKADMAKFRAARDHEAMRLGVAKLEYEQYEMSVRRRLAEIDREEQDVAARIARDHGIDPEKRFWYEHETGEMVEG